jgi:hypothetical protein
LILVSGRHDGRRILLPIAVLRSKDPADLTHEIYTALLDTGATTSWISPKVISDLGLTEVGKDRVSFAMDQRLAPVYLFRLGAFADGTIGQGLPFVFAETRGFRMNQRDDFDVILGMNVLSQGDLSVRRTGDWNLKF